jgi:hypothetical protein
MPGLERALHTMNDWQPVVVKRDTAYMKDSSDRHRILDKQKETANNIELGRELT